MRRKTKNNSAEFCKKLIDAKNKVSRGEKSVFWVSYNLKKIMDAHINRMRFTHIFMMLTQPNNFPPSFKSGAFKSEFNPYIPDGESVITPKR